MPNLIKKFKGGSLSETTLMENDRHELFVRKTVSLVENREYGFQRWYSQLKRIQRYNAIFPGVFPNLIGYGQEGDTAFMDIEYFSNGMNAQEYIETCKKSNDIDIFIDELIKSMHKMHQKAMIAPPKAIDLYLNEEVDRRLNDCLKDHEFNIFLKHDNIVFNGHNVQPLMSVLEEYKGMCRKYYKGVSETFTHGNITLENLLYIKEERRVVFIDPYEENIIDSDLAEYSQLLQSSNGKYEMYNSDDATIVGNNVTLELSVPYGIEYFNNQLIDYLQKKYSFNDYIMIRLFEVSQFIRMLPFKLIVDKNKMIFFYSLASYLYSELKKEISYKRVEISEKK